jgi:hypothetical protein
MTRLIITFIAVYLLATPAVLACNCDYQGSFMKMIQRTPLVAVVKVTKYLTFKEIYYVKTPMSMEVEIVEVYKGKENRKTVIVWGDIGNFCRPYLSEFKEGQYYVIAFEKGRYGGGHPDEKDTDYSISICGTYWLTVDLGKSNVIGDIDSGNRTISTIRLSDLRSRLMNAEQSSKLSGLLLMSPWRTHQSFDLFLPCVIDTLSSLTENIRLINKDTAMQIYGGDFAFHKHVVKLRNQSFDSSFAHYLQFCLVLPIVAEYDTAAEKLFKNTDERDVLYMPYTFNGKTITEYYRTKEVYLKNIRVLGLRNDKNGYQHCSGNVPK